MNFDWNDLAFGSKKPVRELNATFIAAPRELSVDRFKQLVKECLPKGNIVLGLAKEEYIAGFDGQPHFKTLQLTAIEGVITKVNAAQQTNKIYTLSYFQRDVKYLFEKLDFARVVLVNGSWKHTFHTQAPYYALVNHGTPYRMVSPFVDEAEAKAYEAAVAPRIKKLHPFKPGTYAAEDMMSQAADIATCSFDYGFQTGVALGKKESDGKYALLGRSFNRVVPYQTYAMHHGASREQNFSPPHDLNHYDTIHAEVAMIIKAGKDHIDLSGTTLFINLLPCPACARMFTETDIQEFVYREDHSEGYAVKMLEAAGKTVRRLVV